MLLLMLSGDNFIQKSYSQISDVKNIFQKVIHFIHINATLYHKNDAMPLNIKEISQYFNPTLYQRNDATPLFSNK